MQFASNYPIAESGFNSWPTSFPPQPYLIKDAQDAQVLALKKNPGQRRDLMGMGGGVTYCSLVAAVKSHLLQHIKILTELNPL